MEKYVKELTKTISGNSYRYKTERGEISLIYPSRYTLYRYEIYCIDGDLFEGTERYETKEEAEELISALLEPK